ncbi:MAG: hypothetical protein JWM93_3093 [Frankiales bacterium]|nr:hypothetical protein [Frankiales bacterium]
MLALAVLLLAGLLFGVAAVSVGHGSPLSDSAPDRRPPILPADKVNPADLESLRFTMALRGYRMDEVDAVLDRLSTELSVRDAEISRLRASISGPALDPAPLEPDAAPDPLVAQEPADQRPPGLLD